MKRPFYKDDRRIDTMKRAIYKMHRENFSRNVLFCNLSGASLKTGCLAGKNKRQTLFIKASAQGLGKLFTAVYKLKLKLR